MLKFKSSFTFLFIFSIAFLSFKVVFAESIFTTPDVFVTSKIKPTKDYDSANILRKSSLFGLFLKQNLYPRIGTDSRTENYCKLYK